MLVVGYVEEQEVSGNAGAQEQDTSWELRAAVEWVDVVLSDERLALTLTCSLRCFVNKSEQLQKNPIKFKIKLPTASNLI